jgi:hypothetical protein
VLAVLTICNSKLQVVLEQGQDLANNLQYFTIDNAKCKKVFTYIVWLSLLYNKQVVYLCESLENGVRRYVEKEMYSNIIVYP